MPAPRTPFAKTLALKSLELAVHLWPAEARQWGQALLAETHEIANPVDAFFWALGGVTLLLRSHLFRVLLLLQLPPGHTPSGINTNGSQPRNPRLVTVIVLAGIAFLFLLPSSREATSVVVSSWGDFQPTPSDVRVVERLAAKAEQDRDARQLAFLANCIPDPDRGERFANRAVELDPSLFWIYAGRYRRPVDNVNMEWLIRMRNSDPDNAFVYLLAAQAAVDARFWSIFGPSASPNPQASQVPRYRQWSSNMQRAFQAPRYDSYARLHLELTREGWKNAPEVPVSLAAYSLWSHLLPDLAQIEKYTDQQIAQAREAVSASRPEEAERILQQVASFGQRMTDGSETDFERLGAIEIARRGQSALREFYALSGRSADLRVSVLQLQALETRKGNLLGAGAKSRGESWRYFRKRAILVQSSIFAAFAVAALTMLCFVLLEIYAAPWRHFCRIRWMACRMVDFGPATVLTLAAAFLTSFRPFALASQQYRSAIQTNTASLDFSWQLMPLGCLHPLLYLCQPSGQATSWLLLIIFLSSIVAAMIARAIRRHVACARSSLA